MVQVVEDNDGRQLSDWRALALVGDVRQVLPQLLTRLVVHVEGRDHACCQLLTRSEVIKNLPIHIFTFLHCACEKHTKLVPRFCVHLQTVHLQEFIPTPPKRVSLHALDGEVLGEFLREESFAGAARAAQDDALVLEQQRHVALHDRLRDQRLERQAVDAVLQRVCKEDKNMYVTCKRIAEMNDPFRFCETELFCSAKQLQPFLPFKVTVIFVFSPTR